ncbi:regulator of G-protein signaling domain-containing protein [Albimonas pacifica]|uniref:RGS domain-containing protein n=1 Tax=Albimonas pacifica TaxID=1114924 RepID=A0A1I3E8C1_9RHOB|nr:regulator of G-protein signaling domain-containing protein [Albimonas pacifica]SFH95093.1 hypothetical protein SAMN05216258_103233 [Albimonas pacifica]
MKRFGAHTYPDTIDTIVADSTFVKVFFNHLVAELSPENLLFYLGGFDPRATYPVFIQLGAKHQINISSAQREPMDELAAAGDWDNVEWVRLISDAREEVRKVMTNDSLTRFWKSDAFLKHHERRGGARADVAQEVADPPPPPLWQRAATTFGFKSPQVLQAYIAAFEAKGETLTLGACRKMLAAENRKMDPYLFNRMLVRDGYARKPADLEADPRAVETEIDPLDAPADLDPETGELQIADVAGLQVTFKKDKLKACGFTLITRDEDLRALSDMVLAHVAKDPDALRRYVQIQKAERQKKNQAIEGITFVKMMKKMREERAYTIGGAVAPA